MGCTFVAEGSKSEAGGKSITGWFRMHFSFYTKKDAYEYSIADSLKIERRPHAEQERLSRGMPIVKAPSNFQSKIVKQDFDQNAPDYQRPSHGLNFHSVCRNQKCEANGQHVYVKKNFGEFILTEEADDLECPKCCEATEPSTVCGFYMAKWKFEGELKSGETKKLSGCADTEHFYTFIEGCNENWEYLQVTATPLQESS